MARHTRAQGQGQRRQRGASLIEVMIAFVVLALGITSIVSFQGRLASESTHAKSRTEAANVAESKMEDFRNFGTTAEFDAIDSSPTGGVTVDSSDIANLSNVYTLNWTVTNVPTSNPTHKKVDLTVTWPDANGNTSTLNTVSLSTIVARVDPKQTVLNVSTTSTTSTTLTTSTTTTTLSTTTTTLATTTSTSSTTTTTTTTTPEETTTTVEATSTTVEETTTTSAESPTTTSSTVSSTTTSTAAPVACGCERNGSSANAKLDGTGQPAACTVSCCTAQMPTGTPPSGGFTAYCPAM